MCGHPQTSAFFVPRDVVQVDTRDELPDHRRPTDGATNDCPDRQVCIFSDSASEQWAGLQGTKLFQLMQIFPTNDERRATAAPPP